MKNYENESTERLLKVIIALLLRRREENPTSLREQIAFLDSLNLKPAEIAGILGRTINYINKELSGIRKKRKSNEPKKPTKTHITKGIL